MWDERCSQKEFAYGEEANQFLKEELLKLKCGKILFPAEGEGRNAVFAAKNGWDVNAFDLSVEGKKKALLLAEKHLVKIKYELGKLENLNYTQNQFDTLALIYAHFPADIKSKYHKILTNYIRPGGIIIFEAFSKNHLEFRKKNPKVGGPNDLSMLFSKDEIKADFEDFDILLLEEKEVELHEGLYHNGIGMVIRFVGRKK